MFGSKPGNDSGGEIARRSAGADEDLLADLRTVDGGRQRQPAQPALLAAEMRQPQRGIEAAG